MRVCVVGCLGNMGRRYASVLDYLEIDSCGIDVGDPIPKAENYIIATPTSTHVNVIATIKENHPDAWVLCEKPVSKSLEEIKSLEKYDNVYMVNNYFFVANQARMRGLTVYDYYNSGADGLPWDCIQLIHLAKGEINLQNISPVWECLINHEKISKDDIDASYVDMIRAFVWHQDELLWGQRDIQRSHEKVIAYIEGKNG